MIMVAIVLEALAFCLMVMYLSNYITDRLFAKEDERGKDRDS